MQRRDFIALSGSAALWSFAARAQQATMPVVGFFDPITPDVPRYRLPAFLQGLGETGYVEGRTVAIEYRSAEGQYDRLPELAADLVRRQVSVIVAATPSVQAAMAATKTIPIVFVIAGDPIKDGLVASLNRPGGNLTGVTVMGVEIGSKRLQLLHELVPTASSIGLLVNPARPSTQATVKELDALASTLGLRLHVVNANTPRDIDDAFASLAQMQAGALMIASDPFFNSRYEQLAALTIRYAMPTIYQYREFAEAGGLVSYGASLADAYHLAGVYVGRILKGEKPENLPVQQATKLDLYINLKTAKSMGLDIPLPLLGLADEVIE